MDGECYRETQLGESRCKPDEQCIWGCALWNHWATLDKQGGPKISE